ncbi:MAG: response regulator [Sandaracinaceae bacterium]|nr:response regulator [Sandaracinaceae bacterium]
MARLRRDALTDFVPVVVLFQPGVPVDPIALREAGAVDSLRKPLLIKTILQTVHRVADLGEAATWAPLGDLTVNDVADRIAAEIRRGLVLSTDRGPDVAVPLGDGSEVLAAAWAAIARVRAHLSERSAGRVHFRDPAGRRGPALVSLHDLEPTAEEEARDSASEAEVSLRGRRVIVADDDPAVRWFFAQLLEDEGASVVQAEDGAVALAAARAEPPDVIVSDILMPNMDGLALCRALSRDPSVSETPVILLSWREDFLSRMRELRAGARGYLRKEAESTQILAKVRDVLRGRSQFEGAPASGWGGAWARGGPGHPVLAFHAAARARERAAHGARRVQPVRGGGPAARHRVRVQHGHGRWLCPRRPRAAHAGGRLHRALRGGRGGPRGAAQHGWRSAAARRGRGLCAARRAHRLRLRRGAGPRGVAGPRRRRARLVRGFGAG